MDTLPISELLKVAAQAGVFQQMGASRRRQVIVDYVPARESMVIPREPDSEEAPLQPDPPTVIPLTFTLEDAMFGGTVFVALICGCRVIINPFAWVSYEHLASLRIDQR